MAMLAGRAQHLYPVVGPLQEIQDDPVVGSGPRGRSDTVDEPTIGPRDRESRRGPGAEQIDDHPVGVLEPEHLEGSDLFGSQHHPGRVRPVVETNAL